MQRQHEKEIEVLKERHADEVKTIILEKEILFKTVHEENNWRENLGTAEDKVEMTNSSLNTKTFEQENLDRELTQQSVLFQEQLENTLKNLEINDRDRMEKLRNKCLKAMDIQNHLTACRHMTDMMQLLATQRKQNKHRNMKTRNEQESIIRETSGEHARLNQSKSIKHLWKELLGTIDDVHNAPVDSDEKEIVDKIQKIRGDLNFGKVDEIFVISEHETNRTASDVDACKLNQRPIVEWEKSNEDEILDGNSFTSLLFKQPQARRISEIAKVTSSIMKMARGELKLSEYDNLDTLMKKLLVDLATPDVEVLLLPKTRASHIKDSIDGIERRVS